MASEPVLSKEVGKRTSRVVQPVMVMSFAAMMTMRLFSLKHKSGSWSLTVAGHC